MPDKRQHDPSDDPPGLAIRRHMDRCFHEVEEVVYADPDAGQVPGEIDRNPQVLGYILDGVMIDPEDVADVRPIP